MQQLRRFLGLASYYRRFVCQFARVAEPLHYLTCKNVAFKWSQECQAAFEELKRRLVTPPVLAYPNFDVDLVLEPDASHQGLGAVISQRQEDDKLPPIAYVCHSREELWDYRPGDVGGGMGNFQFHYYLYGHCVTVYTDHSAVKAVLETARLSGFHTRWWTRVFSRGMKEVAIVYHPEKDKILADALSLNPTSNAPVNGLAEEENQVAAVKYAATTISDMLEAAPAARSKCNLEDEQCTDPEVKHMLDYLESDVLPEDQKEAHSIVTQAPSFCVLDA